MQEINDINVVFPHYVPFFLTGDETLLAKFRNAYSHSVDMRGVYDIPAVLNELEEIFKAGLTEAGANALSILCQVILAHKEKQEDNSAFILQDDLHYYLTELKDKYHHPIGDYYEIITQLYMLDENCTTETQSAAKMKLKQLCDAKNPWALKYVMYG